MSLENSNLSTSFTALPDILSIATKPSGAVTLYPVDVLINVLVNPLILCNFFRIKCFASIRMFCMANILTNRMNEAVTEFLKADQSATLGGSAIAVDHDYAYFVVKKDSKINVF